MAWLFLILAFFTGPGLLVLPLTGASASFNSTFVLEMHHLLCSTWLRMASMQQSADWVSDTTGHLPEESLGTAQTIHRESSSHVRLVGGPHRCEGRVEVQRNGEWGTVCDDGWDMNDVAVVCRELGCGAAIWTPSGVIYKPLADEDQKVLIQDVNCTGVEENLIQCEQDEDVYSCSHNEDAGAKCE
ncbi:CD5 antigen-like isoform X1 [Camelus ferus]|nr:CD5 antigen-like isoform X1 [Camelus ferus]